MPWWIWLVLSGFWLAMLIIGVIYVIRHGLSALHTLSQTGNDVSERLSVMSESSPHDEANSVQRPIFTLPLADAAEQYADAHAQVIERKERRQERHMRTWDKWANFNR